MVTLTAQIRGVTVHIQEQNNLKENFGYVTKKKKTQHNTPHCLSVLAQYNANKQNQIEI